MKDNSPNQKERGGGKEKGEREKALSTHNNLTALVMFDEMTMKIHDVSIKNQCAGSRLPN
jgi:hypothetical protein